MNVKCKTMKHLKENIQENLHKLELGKSTTHKKIKENIDKLDFHKT